MALLTFLDNLKQTRNLEYISRCFSYEETLNEQFKTHFTLFGEGLMNTQYSACTENTTGTLSNSFV